MAVLIGVPSAPLSIPVIAFPVARAWSPCRERMRQRQRRKTWQAECQKPSTEADAGFEEGGCRSPERL